MILRHIHIVGKLQNFERAVLLYIFFANYLTTCRDVPKASGGFWVQNRSSALEERSNWKSSDRKLNDEVKN